MFVKIAEPKTSFLSDTHPVRLLSSWPSHSSWPETLCYSSVESFPYSRQCTVFVLSPWNFHTTASACTTLALRIWICFPCSTLHLSSEFFSILSSSRLNFSFPGPHQHAFPHYRHCIVPPSLHSHFATPASVIAAPPLNNNTFANFRCFTAPVPLQSYSPSLASGIAAPAPTTGSLYTHVTSMCLFCCTHHPSLLLRPQLP